jgi:oligogalacturonide lyase
MPSGRRAPPEWRDHEDPTSGVRVRQLTEYKGHSHHFHFTNPGWWDGGRRLLFGSDRENRSNLFSIELDSGEITQLTDLEQEADFLAACVNPTREEAYLWYGRAFDGPRVLCEHRSSFHVQIVHVHPRFSPDGSYVTYTSDVAGYGNVYQVGVPGFDMLPPLK